MTKRIFFLALFFVTLVVVLWIRNVDASRLLNSDQNIILKAEATKESYMLGETVSLNLLLINKSNKPIRVPSLENGYMHIWIASSDRNFREYRGSRWGLSEGGKGVKSGETFTSAITLLWNSKPPQYSSVSENRLQTEYAFSEAGTYFIKATASIWDNNAKTAIESEPIQIVVKEPIGNDLEVWNLIKNNGDIALFIQEGDFQTSQTEEREKLLKGVEQITIKYPNSLLTNQLKQGLEKFRITEERIKELRQKIQNNKEEKPQNEK